MFYDMYDILCWYKEYLWTIDFGLRKLDDSFCKFAKESLIRQRIHLLYEFLSGLWKQWIP